MLTNIVAFLLVALFVWEFYEIVIVDRFGMMKDRFIMPFDLS
jgi:hypothetical protein